MKTHPSHRTWWQRLDPELVIPEWIAEGYKTLGITSAEKQFGHYVSLLENQARRLYRTDARRWSDLVPDCTIANYRAWIQSAVESCGGLDVYTGLRLEGSLWVNPEYTPEERNRAVAERSMEYPSLDHAWNARPGQGKFTLNICSIATNKAKSDLTISDFIKLCRNVVSNSDR